MRFMVPGSTQLKFRVTVCNSSGAATSGLTTASFPTPMVLITEGVSIATLTLSALASVGASFSSGGIFEYGVSGEYRIDASTNGATGIYGLTVPAGHTSGTLICESILVMDSTSAFMPSLVVQDNATTVRATNATLLNGTAAQTALLTAVNAQTGGTLTLATALSSTERNAIADAFLDRNMATGTDSTGRTPRNALRFLRNKVSLTVTPGSMTVYKEDDSTTAWTGVLTTSSTSSAITVIDPG